MIKSDYDFIPAMAKLNVQQTLVSQDPSQIKT